MVLSFPLAALAAGVATPDSVVSSIAAPSYYEAAAPSSQYEEAAPSSHYEEAAPSSQYEEAAPSSHYEAPTSHEAAAAFANVSMPDAGRVEDAVAALEQCSEEAPVRLYLNALIRPEESVELKSLSEIRDGVTYYAQSGHKVHRASKYTVEIDSYTVPIPPQQLLNDDFNALSGEFCCC